MSDVGHVVMGNASIRCLRCGTEQKLSFPMSVNVMAGACDGFEKDHRDCDVDDPRGKARFTYSNPKEWANSWDTGISSKAIYHVLGGGPVPSPCWREPIPHDPSDFGRCYRLLAVAPGWTEQLGEVAVRFPSWAPFVEAWPELCALWEEEEPTGKAPKLYARLQELRKSNKDPLRAGLRSGRGDTMIKTVNPRAVELAKRLTSPGKPGDALSASEFHEVAELLLGAYVPSEAEPEGDRCPRCGDDWVDHEPEDDPDVGAYCRDGRRWIDPCPYNEEKRVLRETLQRMLDWQGLPAGLEKEVEAVLKVTKEE